MRRMRGTMEDWQRVASDGTLLDRAAEAEAGGINEIARLRGAYDETTAAVAIELVKARGRAATKFGGRASGMVADVQGVEQASGSTVACYKAQRMRDALGEGAAVADLCCGIGGDTLALCDVGLAVTAVDREPVRAWMARQNSGQRAEAVCMDVADWGHGWPAGAHSAIHIDPTRRDEGTGRRAWRLDALRPRPDVLTRLITPAGELGAAVKLSPGVDLSALDELAGGAPHGVEFIAEDSRLVQAVLWTGRLRQAERGATLIAHGQTHTLTGPPSTAPTGSIQRYLYAVHPAVERAGLVHLLAGEHDAPLIHPKLGLLSRDTPTESPWLTGFELLAELPWRPKKVRRWLNEHNAGIVEVKTRGKAVDPDTTAKQLRGKGDTPYTVFILRFDVRVVALVCRRLAL